MRPIRLASVAYLNALPLVEGLDAEEGVQLVGGPPAHIADALRDGAVDVALLPTVELLRQPGLERVPGLGIAAEGRVDSVLLFHRVQPEAVRTLSLDPHSRTSQVLALACLDRLYGVRPELREREPRAAWSEGEDDAVLAIGDLALAMGEEPHPRLDLAEAWHRLTGLPMVFAVWAARPGTLARHPHLPALLDAAAERGRLAIDAIAARAEAPLGPERRRVYLRERIRYRLGPREESGLHRYLEEARAVLARGVP